MLVTIYTPQNKLMNRIQAKSVYLPGTNGDMQILDNHIPLLSSLSYGDIVVEIADGTQVKVPLDFGYAQFKDNEMIIVLEKTSLSKSQLIDIETKAIQMRSKQFGKEDITEDEFFDSEQSERKI